MKFVVTLLAASLISTSRAADPKPVFTEPQLTQPIGISDPVPQWLARWELARALTYAERYDEALIQYKKLQLERPQIKESVQREMVTALFWSGDKEAAQEILKQLGPDADESGQMLIADLFVADKKYDEAVAAYQSILVASPDHDEARVRLAEVLSWQKKYEPSLVHYKKVLDRHPDDQNVRKKYGMVLMWSGNQKEAIVQLQKSLEGTDEK
jgi:tetratricopeptide (TPR) repeat protein